MPQQMPQQQIIPNEEQRLRTTHLRRNVTAFDDIMDDIVVNTTRRPEPRIREARPMYVTENPIRQNNNRYRAIQPNNINETKVPTYPTTEEIKNWAKNNGVKRRNVRICKHCCKMHAITNKHCDTCKARKTDIRWFKNWNCKPKPRFYHINNIQAPYFLGMEMEVVDLGNIKKDSKMRMAQYIQTNDPQSRKWTTHREYLSSIMSKIHRREFYAKSDSSVDLEIVSHPMSYDYIRKYWNETFGTMVKIFKEHGCRSWLSAKGEQKCGAHIHVSRSIGNITIYKLLKIFYDRNNWKYLEAVSGRIDLIEDRYSGLRKMIEWFPKPMNLIKRKNDHAHRYMPLNFENEHTVEFRMFRGSLNENRLMFYFQWVVALIDYLQIEKLNEVSIINFIQFVGKHANVYRVVDYYFANHKEINKSIKDLTHVHYSTQFKETDKRKLTLELSDQ